MFLKLNKRVSFLKALFTIGILIILVGILGIWQYMTVIRDIEEIPETVSKLPKQDFEIVQRIPEGTKSHLVERSKVVKGPLDQASIVFNQKIDQSTLTKENFYALGGIEEKLQGKIIYSRGSNTISFVFEPPIQGGPVGQETRITMVVKGIKDSQGNQIDDLYNIDIID